MEPRVTVSKLDLLLGGQALEAVVVLALGADLVDPGAVGDAEEAEDEDAGLAAQVDGVARVVLGRVRVDVGPSVLRKLSVHRNI